LNAKIDYRARPSGAPGVNLNPTTLVQSGASSDLVTVFGGHIGVRASYDLSERWRVFGTVNYLGASPARFSVGGARSLTLDFDQTFLLTLGVGCSFGAGRSVPAAAAPSP
jgi:hypothetical protein